MNYLARFLELLQNYTDLQSRKRELDAEMAKLVPVLTATYNALTDREKLLVASPIAKVKWEIGGSGLKEAVTMALNARNGEWLTPPEVRNYLEAVGLDFGTAGDRGLASIGTTLKRMVPEEVEAKPIAVGQIGYRSRHYDARKIIEAEVRDILRRDRRK